MSYGVHVGSVAFNARRSAEAEISRMSIVPKTNEKENVYAKSHDQSKSNGKYRNVGIELFAEPPSNPRKRFNEESLKELADYVPGHNAFCALEVFAADYEETRIVPGERPHRIRLRYSPPFFSSGSLRRNTCRSIPSRRTSNCFRSITTYSASG